MASEWRDVIVEEIAASTRNALVGGPFGSNLVSRDYVNNGVPVIRGQNMSGRWLSGEFAFVTEEKARSLEANLARPGDIVFTQRGTLGQVSLVPKGPFDRYVVSQSQMKLSVNQDIADPRFFYYMFISAEHQDYIRQHTIQTGVPHTNLGILRSTPVRLPKLPEQRAIAHILGTLDDKIELNRRMIETLEEMARALFKSWFVDFDPVRAKAEGRETGLPAEIDALFPDRFVDSEVGEIPEGWGVSQLGDILTESNERIGDLEAPVYSSTNEGLQLRSEGFRKKLAASTAKNKLIRYGSLVFGLSRRVLNFGLMRGEIGSVSSAYKVFRVREEILYSDLLERLMRLQANYFYMAVAASSREGQSISVEGLSLLRIVLPPREIQQAFYSFDDEFGSRNRAIECETATLASIRDTLLPKLISGELRVKDADRFLESSGV